MTAQLTVGSVCSGIGAPETAWRGLGWHQAFLSEIEPFPRAVLAHRFPGVPVHGDFTTIEADTYGPVDLLVGGTPCQSFSVAGLRRGMDDARGNLALEYLRLADRLRARWLVWENVPGVLSSSDGRDFGAFLGGLGELGYGFAYRVLDAQHFGVAQRRRRVFVVGYLGDWRRAAAVLFEPASLRGHPAPRREAGEGTAHGLAPSLTASGRGVERAGDTRGQDPVVEVARCLTTGEGNRQDGESCTLLPVAIRTANTSSNGHGFGEVAYTLDRGAGLGQAVAHTLRGEGFDASEDGTGRGTPLVPVSFPWQMGGSQQMPVDTDMCGALIKSQTPAVAFDLAQITSATNRSRAEPGLPRSTLAKESRMHAATASAVRRLTPTECERLQGFPDGHTLIPWRGGMSSDGPRYKALGNSMAVPVLRWIGNRIAAVEAEGGA